MRYIINGDFKRVGLNEYLIDKEVNYVKRMQKSVIIEGETYVKNWVEDCKFNTIENFNKALNKRDCVHGFGFNKGDLGTWYTHKIDEFEVLGIPTFYLWDTRYFYNSLYVSGTNTIAAIYTNLIDWGFLNKYQIKDIVAGRGKIYNNLHNIVKHNSIWITLFHYGSGCYVQAEIDLIWFIKRDFKLFQDSKVSHYWRELLTDLNQIDKGIFPEKLFTSKLTDKKLNDIAIRLLNLKINNKIKTQ